MQKKINDDQLLLPGETIVVGVSGGVDSTALVHILWSLNKQYQYGWKLHVVHLNHSFRGAESDGDAAYVESFCHTLEVKCHLFKRDVKAMMAAHQMGAQEASRIVRYQLYEQVAEEVGAGKVVVAHHADDQVETILFRLLRGTSLAGLAGIPLRRWLIPQKLEIVRPLLSFKKEELIHYCEEQGIHPREDSSNKSRKYARNRLRLDVMPVFRDINPKYREHILQLAELVEADNSYMLEQSRRQLERVVELRDEKKMVISRKKFQTCDLALQRRMITLILSYLSSGIEWSSQHVEAVLRIIQNENPSAILHLPNRLMVNRIYESIHFVCSVPEEKNRFFLRDLAMPGTTELPEQGVTFHAKWLKEAPDWRKLPKHAVVFDGDRLPGKLFVRNRISGDRILQQGVSGMKKLKELFIDIKLPKAWRDKVPIVMSGDHILWIPGVRRSSLAMVDETTSNVLYLEAEFGKEWQEVFDA